MNTECESHDISNVETNKENPLYNCSICDTIVCNNCVMRNICGKYYCEKCAKEQMSTNRQYVSILCVFLLICIAVLIITLVIVNS
jgi:hypothetical protein